MNPHYFTQTEASLQKTLPPAKLKEKLESLTEDIEMLKEGLENQAKSVQTIEKHNSLLLRQFDQLRTIFEKFYEEILEKTTNTEKKFQDKITQLEINTQPKLMKLEKLSELNNQFREKTMISLSELQQMTVKVEKLNNENGRFHKDLRDISEKFEELRNTTEKNLKGVKQSTEVVIGGMERRLNESEKGVKNNLLSIDEKVREFKDYFEGFKEQMHKDFFIITNWAGQVDRQLSSIPLEFTKHLDKFFEDLEKDLHKKNSEQKEALHSVYTELNRKIESFKSQKGFNSFSNY